jgi:hypothetical protein
MSTGGEEEGKLPRGSTTAAFTPVYPEFKPPCSLTLISRKNLKKYLSSTFRSKHKSSLETLPSCQASEHSNKYNSKKNKLTIKINE